MERPFDLDDNATWHDGNNDCDYTCDGDGSLNGMHKGVAFYGDGICPDCFSEGRRVEILSMARKMCEEGQ